MTNLPAVLRLALMQAKAAGADLIAHVTFASGRSLPHFKIDAVTDIGLLGRVISAPANQILVVFSTVETVEFE